MADTYDQLSLLSDLIDSALKQGADAADAVVFDASSVSVSCRLGELEKLERSESNDLGLRVFVGKQQAVVSSTDFEPDTLWDVVERAVAMAKAVKKPEHRAWPLIRRRKQLDRIRSEDHPRVMAMLRGGNSHLGVVHRVRQCDWLGDHACCHSAQDAARARSTIV